MQTSLKFVCAVCLTFVIAGLAQAQPSNEQELLNSERIEQAFGSYGVELLSSSSTTRVSNLYSLSGGRRICRTFAVTAFSSEIAPAIASEHAAILDGGSIGTTFTQSGWRVLKDNLYFGEIESTPKIRALMGGIGSSRLAVHVYVLNVAKDGVEIEYASLVEVHHPDYLRVADLERIYGGAAVARIDATVEALLRLAAQHMR